MPEIRLEGKWLANLGFEIGNEVDVRSSKCKLIITPRKDNEGKA